ncbi:MAG: zinc-ribbon domain-containing protein [Lachnospiraceae bacterium]|nr:zinc-ribbon domain-containing protein [Lachnospiraceae bacterium]
MANCPNCGAVINDGESFCSNCGTPVTAQTPVTTAEPAAAPIQSADAQANYQQQIPQPVYQQPVYQGAAHAPVEQPIGIGDWFLTILLLMIPIVNIIMLFIWAFSSETPTTKSNFAKAQLIWAGIGIVLSILFSAVIVSALVAIGSSL